MDETALEALQRQLTLTLASACYVAAVTEHPMASSTTPSPFAQTDALTRLAHALLADGYHFTTVSPATHQRMVARPEKAWATSARDVFGWNRPFRKPVLPDHIMSCMRDADVLEPVEDGWRSRVRFSTLNTGLYVHSAFPTMDTDAVFFGPDTYRFVRSIDAYLHMRRAGVERAVDIGCGAGPGAISIARRHPQAQIHALDINPAALQATMVNARVNHVNNVVPHESNLFSAVDGSFDLIVANPPYLNDPAGRAYRHGGGALGEQLSISILEAALPRLAPTGTLLLYTGVAMVDGVDPLRQYATRNLGKLPLAWHYEELDPDVFGDELDTEAYSHADRIAAVLLTVTSGSLRNR